jgi:DHA1 family bicyclomycin/chloramphenicol resistance-like MFS transporter
LLWLVTWRWLPESLHTTQVQPFEVRHLMRGYVQPGTDPRFLLMALASGIRFNGMFLYVLSAPAFLGGVLGLGPTQSLRFFFATIGGIMSGALLSGRLAGRIEPRVQIGRGFAVMIAASVVNLGANLAFDAQAWWAIAAIGRPRGGGPDSEWCACRGRSGALSCDAMRLVPRPR